MFGISETIRMTVGYQQSVILNFRNADVFTIDTTDALEFERLLKKRFFEKSEIPDDLFSFLRDNRMIFELPKAFKDGFPKRNEIHYSKSIIQHLSVDYGYKVDLKAVVDLCSRLLTPCLIVKTDDDVVSEIESLIVDRTFPESVTIVTNNESLLDKNRIYRILIEVLNDDPFVNRDAMESNYPLFVESKYHHTYFNSRMHIEEDGSIKNVPEMIQVIGNINTPDCSKQIKALVTNEGFQQYWNVHKEACDVCKDCEFRHMCVDNRIPVQRSSNEWYHEAECNYNPYIGKWKGEEGYHSLATCGVKSDANGFGVDCEKIRLIVDKVYC